MYPTTPVPIPIGRQAILAWRSLNPRARDEAWAAARQRSAPADLGVAYTAAGYGRTMARRRRVAMVLAAPLYLLVLIIVLVALLLAGVRPSAAPLVAVVVMAAYAAVAIPLWTQWRRFLRLHHSGVFGIEVAAMRAPQEVPGASPVAGPPPDPAQTRTVRIRVGRLLMSLAVLPLSGLLMWAQLVRAITKGPADLVDGILTAFLALLTVAYTVVIGFLAAVNARYLFDPVVARFTAEGWELPARKMRGSWSRVRAIRIRTAGRTRVVALQVDDPARYLAQVSPLSRMLGRRAMTRYGSPVTIVAGSGWTVPVQELVHMLRDYTDAPLDWG